MTKVESIIPVSELRRDATRILRKARTSKDPVFITRRGRTVAVLMSVKAFEKRESQREILLSLARGQHEISSGISHSLESVLAEADKLLSRS